jgi:hypothetical protein
VAGVARGTLRALPLSRSVLRALVTRAVVLWMLLRAFLTAVFLLLPSSAVNGGQAESPHPDPVAIIVICTLVGVIDTRRRGEAMLWANLGVPMTQLTLLFAVTATVAETLLLMIVR